ncbi:DnaJ-domain-containing protein [Ascoidea rubescens DSM 1968]|uniref:DnaJ-domain-containing protein n=1 Tax=Ascoidea rubescens DSM 1968 TaxID=1344418 RepID=A0A1D2VDS3_9ASCO|nr:DnaJ-domain-containing protein [Ascoidea rubescens DSM 1968]ODV59617.1 DnaJ-domain-containing protein [Ascoidea rubescens DSM 1968]
MHLFSQPTWVSRRLLRWLFGRTFSSSLQRSGVVHSSDPYKVLQLETGATAVQIKKAYFKLAKQHHPDVSKEPDAVQSFHIIQNAYEKLTDPNYSPYNNHYDGGDDDDDDDYDTYDDDDEIYTDDLGSFYSQFYLCFSDSDDFFCYSNLNDFDCWAGFNADFGSAGSKSKYKKKNQKNQKPKKKSKKKKPKQKKKTKRERKLMRKQKKLRKKQRKAYEAKENEAKANALKE